MESKIKPWKLKWTEHHISSFWDWASQSRFMQSIYFSKSVSHVILNHSNQYIGLNGMVIDYGCGPGDFMDHLLRRDVTAVGLDVSADSIAALRQRFAGNPRFQGGYVLPMAAADLPGGKADLVFMIESVEHMDDDALHQAFANIRGLLKPGGHVVVTTPNDEDLDASEVFCPNCGCLFHRMQHQRTWTAASLGAWMEGEGFAPVVCEPYHIYDKSPVKGWMQRVWRNFRYPKPNQLMYIGRMK